jgi:hypothetical protein
LTYVFSAKITKNTNLSLILVSAIFLNIPLFNFAVLNFTDVVGAVIFIFALYNLLYTKKYYLLVTIVLSFLPWVHVRYSFVALILYLLSILRIPNQQKYLRFLPPLSSICYLVFSKIIFGSFNPYIPYIIFGDTAFYGHFFKIIKFAY